MKTLRRSIPYNCLTFTFALVLFAVGGNVAWADSGAASFSYIVFPGSFCAPAPPCPDVARAANGDTVEIAGAGTLSIHPKSVAGGGTFTHKNSAGAVIATGTWTAIELLSFNDYGPLPAAFGLPPTFHGGQVFMRVHLSPSTGGAGFDAILEVDCAANASFFGLPPGQLEGAAPEGHTEGVRLAVEGGPNFSQRVGGFTVFIVI